jgi:hypothetical protein
MAAHHLIHLLTHLAQNPGWAVARLRTHMRPPLWSRSLAGALMPPWTGTSKFRSLYVVTYGRSGSTLVNGYLSHLPGVDLKGENYLFPLPLADAESRLSEALALGYTGRELPASPWYGSHQFSTVQWRRDIRRALLNQLYPFSPIPKTVGFKEIRWWYRLEAADFEQKLAWLISVRQPGAIVFLTRNLDKTMAGAWWAKQSDEERAKSRAGLENFEVLALAYAAAHPDHSVHITYEDFCADSAAAKRINKLLGVKFREDLYQHALGERYSYPSQPTQASDGDSSGDTQSVGEL